MEGHYWAGSLCRISEPKPAFPRNVIAVSDTITIMEDMGNRIPDKSWMLYLLELFDRKSNLPIELNLICQFNDRDNFWAIFGGTNRHKFTRVLPVVGHSYGRLIAMQRRKGSIEYFLQDKTTNQSESFIYPVKGLAFEGANHFTGIEWWNRAGSSPFPVRYAAEISQLRYGVPDGSATSWLPYSVLVPNSDRRAAEYPVSFGSPTADAGFLCYTVTDGATGHGLQYVSA